MSDVPDLDDLIGGDLPAEERGRLARAHELLLLAGPRPELPASLVRPPERNARTPRPPPRPSSRPRHTVLATAAAALVLFAFGAGYLAGGRRTGGFRRAAVAEMHGTAAAPTASATIRLGSRDRAGNWPMTIGVRGLAPLPSHSYYQLYLTKQGHGLTSCGTFKVAAGTTVVRLNVPYQLNEYSGWIITRHQAGQASQPAVLTT